MFDDKLYGLFTPLRGMKQGRERRQCIKKFFKDNPTFALPVNNKWQLIVEYDTDLSFLIKKEFLIRKRSSAGGKKKQTYLVLKVP